MSKYSSDSRAEQTKAMTHLDLDETKYHEDTNRQAAKEAEGA